MPQRRLRIVEDNHGGLSGKMQQLGFSDYESRIYIHLLQNSPSTAYEVSKATGLPRPNTYSAIESLAQRGVVQPVSEDPVTYVATDPSILLQQIANSTRKICDDLEEEFAQIAKPVNSNFVWTTRGEIAVEGKVSRMIVEARESIWIKATDRRMRRHREELRSAAERGVDILLVLFGEDPDEFCFGDNVRVLLHEGNGQRNGMADNVFSIVVDHIEVLAANTQEEVLATNMQEVVHAAYTQNPTLVTMAETMIRHEYYLANLFLELGDQINECFGPHLANLREACFTPEQFRLFKERLGID